ncbi:endonuclease domain-containing protein [Ornithinimicrobium sp. Arc0846-15]|nr:endonuclease domain-containing protein [Ornithinimicrobium laminariae]
MDRDLEAVLAAHGGVVASVRLQHLGIGPREIDRLVRRRDLVRPLKGVVAHGGNWQAAKPWELHRLRALAACCAEPPATIALSHQSGLAMSSLPIFGADERIHLMRLPAPRKHSTSKVAFHAPVSPEWLVPCGQQFRVRDSLAALQVADAFGVEAGLVSADAVARAGAQQSEFTQALSAGRFARGLARPRQVIKMLNPELESPGESRCRWLFHILDIPVAEPQVEFTLPSGRIARVDFYFRERRTVVEFDGQIKHARAGDLFAEKKREDGLRSLGLEVVRLVWSDLSEPQRVRSLLETAFSRARRMR